MLLHDQVDKSKSISLVTYYTLSKYDGHWGPHLET